jgi:hypothetical protein
MGSVETLVSMKPHFGHSNSRFSQEPELGAIAVKAIEFRHLAQSGRSTGQRKTSVNDRRMAAGLGFCDG